MESLGFHVLVFNFFRIIWDTLLKRGIYMQGEKEEALSKRWEIVIHISYSGVSANADPEGFNCFNLCFILLGYMFWDFQFHWLISDFSDLKKSL